MIRRVRRTQPDCPVLVSHRGDIRHPLRVESIQRIPEHGISLKVVRNSDEDQEFGVYMPRIFIVIRQLVDLPRAAPPEGRGGDVQMG